MFKQYRLRNSYIGKKIGTITIIKRLPSKRFGKQICTMYEGVCDNNALVRPPLFRADGYFIRREKKIPFLYLIEVENHSKLTAEKLHWYAEIFDDFCTSETSWEFRVIVPIDMALM